MHEMCKKGSMMNTVCPSCGYCPCCGQRLGYNYYPYNPYQPIYFGGLQSAGLNPNINLTGGNLMGKAPNGPHAGQSGDDGGIMRVENGNSSK